MGVVAIVSNGSHGGSGLGGCRSRRAASSLGHPLGDVDHIDISDNLDITLHDWRCQSGHGKGRGQED